MIYNDNNLTFYPVITDIENFLNLPPILDSEVLAVARESYKEPNFENILMTESLNAIVSCLTDIYPGLEFEIFANSSDTHFYCNRKDIKSVNDLLDVIRECFWIVLNFEQAWYLFNNTNFEIYFLYDDGSESLIESTTDFITTEDTYGIERCNK